MGKRGPKTEPTLSKAARGNPGQRRLNQNEPQPKGKAEMPGWLSDAAKKEWERLAPELERLGVLTAVDEKTFATYCQSVADFIAAVKAMKGQPVMIEGASGAPKRHPGWELLSATGDRVIKYGSQFGLTPSSRTGISVPSAPKEGDLKAFVKMKSNLKFANDTKRDMQY